MEYIVSFIILIGIFVLTFYSTRFLGTKVNARMKSKYMQWVDSLMVDRETRITILKIKDQYFVTTQSKGQISSLVPLENFEEDQEIMDEKRVAPFTTIFKNLVKDFKRDDHK